MGFLVSSGRVAELDHARVNVVWKTVGGERLLDALGCVFNEGNANVVNLEKFLEGLKIVESLWASHL
jgi:hypothetical protein